MQTIGERLEEARKRKGISIREASEATKIRSDYLHKLESNSFDLNLPEIYIRGFLRNYANYLKLNADKMLADYKSLAPNEGRASRRENREIYGRMDLAQTARQTAEAAPAAAGTEAPAARGRPGPAQLSRRGQRRHQRPLTPPCSSKAASSWPRWSSSSRLSSASGRFPAGRRNLPSEDQAAAQQTITLIARDTVRVKLVQELDGAELFQGTLIKGESRTFTKRGSLLLTATALENVDIEINGKRQANPYSGYMRVQIP